MSSKICSTTLSKINKHFFNNPANPYPQFIKNVKFQNLNQGHCKVTYEVTKLDTNAVNTLHGGFIATLLDNVTVFAAMTKLDDLNKNSVATTNIHINYKTAGKVGQNVVVDAKVNKGGRRLMFTDCRIYEEGNEGKVLADGSQTFEIVDI